MPGPRPPRVGVAALLLALLLGACQQVGSAGSSPEVPTEAGGEPAPAPEPVVEAPAPEPVVEAPPAPEPIVEAPAPEPVVEAPAPQPSTPAPSPQRPGSGGVAATKPLAPVEGVPEPAEVTPDPAPTEQSAEVAEVEAPTSGTAAPDVGPRPETPSVDAAPAQPIPQFPWPPPRASASVVIPADFVRPSGVASPTLGDIADEISKALDTGGYYERSYFGAPGGFAMVTRLERINPDGTPKDEAERWTVGNLPLSSFSLAAYLRALFTAPSGHYRIIVFIVSSKPFAQSQTQVEQGEALAWLSEGLNRLPDNIALAPYTDRHTVTALIYEFEQPGSQDALLRLPGNLMGRVHLQRAQLWDALSNEP